MSMKSVKTVILIISTLLFLYQLHTAIMLLLYPPIIVSSSKIDISDIDLPLITICATDQVERHKEAFTIGTEYLNSIRLIQGTFGRKGKRSNLTSWGDHLKKTFDEVLNLVYDTDVNKMLNIRYDDVSKRFKGNLTRVFIPAYGYCSEIEDYDPQEDIVIKLAPNFRKLVNGFRVFISDTNFRSKFSLDYKSHRGEVAEVTITNYAMYDIDVSIRSSCEVKPTMEFKDKFHTCVEDELQKQVTGTIGCIPPWMSKNNQCNKSYVPSFFQAIPQFKHTFIDSQYSLKPLKIESDCRKYCLTTTSVLTTRSVSGSGFEQSEMMLSFNPKVGIDSKSFIIFDDFQYFT